MEQFKCCCSIWLFLHNRQNRIFATRRLLKESPIMCSRKTGLRYIFDILWHFSRAFYKLLVSYYQIPTCLTIASHLASPSRSRYDAFFTGAQAILCKNETSQQHWHVWSILIIRKKRLGQISVKCDHYVNSFPVPKLLKQFIYLHSEFKQSHYRCAIYQSYRFLQLNPWYQAR
jgi:hypothetical protein